MDEIKTRSIHPEVRTLLSYASSKKSVEREYKLYIESIVRKLYGFIDNHCFVGCIGVELLDPSQCKIIHIAVCPKYRGEGIGNKMINFIKNKHPSSFISAETDIDAVYFYKRLGFEITSLGENYPGVERFQCILECK